MPNVDKMPTLSETKDSMKILFYVFDYIMLEALKGNFLIKFQRKNINISFLKDFQQCMLAKNMVVKKKAINHLCGYL